jgi:hypothetical protein
VLALTSANCSAIDLRQVLAVQGSCIEAGQTLGFASSQKKGVKLSDEFDPKW